MNNGSLSQYFHGVTAKKLSAVEADSTVSRQHEFNATVEMKKLFGPERRSFEGTVFLYLSDEKETVKSFGKLTWYDARENHPTRSEYRIFYQCPDVMDCAKENDSLFICLMKDEKVLALIAEGNSTVEAQLYWLFGLTPDSRKITVREISQDDVRVNIPANEILETIGIEPVIEDDGHWLSAMMERYDGSFPSTRIFSAFARETVRWKTECMDSADDILVEWLNQEETLFRIYEKYMIQTRLDAGFRDVDDFIQYSLSVQNRRKSRVGQALENHFEEILKQWKLLYVRTPVTENHSKPDFVFPGIEEYHNQSFPEAGLTMLGVKSTCKDRWRQVLAEADRIKDKHLLTLQGSISRNQTDQMQANNLHLVIPESIRTTYDQYQRNWIMTVHDFLGMVRSAQNEYVNGY